MPDRAELSAGIGKDVVRMIRRYELRLSEYRGRTVQALSDMERRLTTRLSSCIGTLSIWGCSSASLTREPPCAVATAYCDANGAIITEAKIGDEVKIETITHTHESGGNVCRKHMNQPCQQLAQLDEIVEWFEQDDFDMEAAIAKFEQGSALPRVSGARLATLDNKISVLKQSSRRVACSMLVYLSFAVPVICFWVCRCTGCAVRTVASETGRACFDRIVHFVGQ